MAPSAAPAPDHGVQLVDEEDHLAVGFGDLLQDRLQPLLELAAVLGAGHQRAHIQRDHALVLQPLGHVAAHDALRQPLDDGGLAHAGLADQHRVVLGAAAQDLDGAPDLLVAPDHRVQLAVARRLRQVAAVLLQRLVGGLRVLAGDALRAAHGGQRRQDAVARDAEAPQQARRPAAVGAGQRQQEMLGADVVVVHGVRFGVGILQDARGPARQARLHVRAVDLRAARQLRLELPLQRGRLHPHLRDDLGHHPFLLLQQCEQQVLRVYLARLVFQRQLLRRHHRFLCFLCIPVQSHICRSNPRARRARPHPAAAAARGENPRYDGCCYGSA